MPATSHARPRIALVASGDLFGGAERQILTLASALQPEFDPVVFASLDGPFVAAARAEGTSIRTDLLHRGTVGAGQHLGEILEAEHFDVIHAHNDRASALAALACGFKPRWPVVRTVHGAPEFAGLWAAATQVAAAVSDRLTRAHQVLVSEDLLHALHKENAPRTHVSHNGLTPPATCLDRPENYACDRFNLVAVGRLGPVKGFEYLIRALRCPELASDLPLLHLVGEGPELAHLRELTQSLALTDHVQFHGFRTDVHRFIRAADALVMPSLHEGIPYVLLEALWLGTPVIASRVGGIPEILTHEDTGFLVPAKDPAALARAIATFRSDRALVQRIVRAGEQRVRTEFSAQRMAERYGALYRELLSR